MKTKEIEANVFVFTTKVQQIISRVTDSQIHLYLLEQIV